MRKAFKYRIYLTHGQRRILEQQLEECRWVYNQVLAARRAAYAEGAPLGLYDTVNLLPDWKAERPTLKHVHSQVLQNICQRVHLSFESFFQRVKRGAEDVGYPRFKPLGRYDSITYPQYGNGVRLEGARLIVSKIGAVQVILHRPIEGTPKTATIRRCSTGKWYVCFSCECVEPSHLPETGLQVGIDVGLRTFATFSTGQEIANPRFFRREECALAKAQRRLSNEKQGASERAQRRKIVARVHERIAWRRGDFAHQHSRRIVNQFDLIAVEDLSVNQMLHNHCLAKSIADAAWSQFASLLAYKAAWAGRKYVAVNPAYTSQDCSSCGHRQPLSLSDRTYTCPCCGIVLDRDLNASLNILSVGQHTLASA
jgi:putative transposase